jgi:hypothetical protein
MMGYPDLMMIWQYLLGFILGSLGFFWAIYISIGWITEKL